MLKGIIYLVQPAELVGTNRYKIGCSGKPNLERIKTGYKKNTRYLSINECDNPFLLENKIKYYFNLKFKLVAGKEYFEGNEAEIIKTFNETIVEYNNQIKNKLI